jgi:hypothetical protein
MEVDQPKDDADKGKEEKTGDSGKEIATSSKGAEEEKKEEEKKGDGKP